MSTVASGASIPAAKADNSRWFIAFAVGLGALLEIIDTSIVNVALADMQAALGTTLAEIGWVITSYAVANVIILPLSAWLGDRFGKKRYFVFSMIAFTIASILCGLATNLPMLIIARVLQGLFGGGLLAKAQAILYETFPKEELPLAQGIFGAVVIAGPAIGPTLGGWLTTNVGWRWIFFINLPLGIIGTMAAIAYIPKDDLALIKKGAVDFFAVFLLAMGLGSVQIVLEEGQREDWWSSKMITFFTVTSIVGMFAFVRRTLRSSAPVVNLHVLKHRALAAGCVLSVIVGIGLYGANFAVPVFATTVMRYTSEQTGWLIFPSAIASAVGMILASKLTKKFDPRALIVVGSLIVVFSMTRLNQLSPSTGGHDFFWPMVLRSIGTVLMFLPLNLAALGSLPKHDIAAGAGLFNLTRQLGGSIGVAGLTALLDVRTAFHRAVLVEKLGADDPRVMERLTAFAQNFIAHGMDVVTAKARALGMLDGIVQMQASILSFNDSFTITAYAFLATLPLVLLLNAKSKAPPADIDMSGH